MSDQPNNLLNKRFTRRTLLGASAASALLQFAGPFEKVAKAASLGSVPALPQAKGLIKRIPGQLMMTGAPAEIDRLLAQAQSGGLKLIERQSVTVDSNGAQMRVGLWDVPTASNGTDDLRGVMIRLIGWMKDGQIKVAVEPNWTIGAPYGFESNPWDWSTNPWDWVGDPWDWGDAPWTWIDDPWDWVDDPWDWDDSPWDWIDNNSVPMVIPVGTSPAEGEALFWRQGAFQKIGLTGPDGVRNPALASRLGDGVKVGVFDALPTNPVNASWLTLHPASVPLTSPSATNRDISDHGLMAASLIHAVAPNARVDLYEVCTKEGYGSVYPLLEAIVAFMAGAAGQPAVINLSLGSMGGTSSPAVRAVLYAATHAGMVVCASAGNLGKRAVKPADVPAAQEPASFRNVIGVSASNLSDQRASYSQCGDIAAPGGEDVGPHGPGDSDDIIGMGVSNPAGQTSGYVAMDGGTSFSAPLVSGAAALLAQQQALDGQTYLRVFASMQAGARQPVGAPDTLETTGLGAGILYLPALFNR